MPFIAAAMPCSRMPECIKRPLNWPGPITAIAFVWVLLEPVRSAEPPIISGTAAMSNSSVSSDALRVAISCDFAAAFTFIWRTAPTSAAGSLPTMRRSNSARLSAASAPTRSFHCLRASVERDARLAPLVQDFGGNFERRVRPAEFLTRPLDFLRTQRRAVGFRCARLMGRPKADRGAAGDHGRLVGSFCAASMACSIAAGSWPSMRLAFQLDALKRAT